MDIHSVIASRVRELRRQQNLSLELLARRNDVSRSTISLIECGESSPTAALLAKLAAALGATLAGLFDETGRLTSQPLPVARAADQPVWTDPRFWLCSP